MVTIRLTRVGKKNSPAYRVVVADKRRAVKRKFIEIVGNYNPTLKPKTVVINKERALFWMKQGAQPSDTVRNLMCDLGILDKKDKVQKVYGKKLSKKAIKEGPKEQPKEEAKEEAAAEQKTAESSEQVAEEPVIDTETVEETPEKTEETAKENE